MADQASEQTAPSSRAGLVRLAIGLAQGLVLYGLYWAATGKASWPATQPVLYGAILLVALFTPLIPLTAIGSMRTRTLAIWTTAAVALTAALAAYGFYVQTGGQHPLVPSFPLTASIAAALFIAHRLVAAGDAERKLIAAYPTYFDTAWKHGVQLALALAFVGAFWLALHLGASLFDLIGLQFLSDLIRKEWFAFPVTTTVFAAAVHLADVRASLTRGIRTVGLTLLSWLMPVMGLIALGFLAALPFTGLDALWKIGRSTAILLSAAGTLVILLNAAYQDGQADTRAPKVLRIAARVTALTLLPLLTIAAIGLGLRVGQHGLTPDRIIAGACLLVGFCYAIGYAIAAVLPGSWMKPLEITNVITAFVILAVILLLLSPVGDPARISTDDQVRRLETGRIAPDKFDYTFLRFDAGRYGAAALKALGAKKTGPNAAAIAAQVAAVMKLTNRWESPPTPPMELAKIKVYPAGQKLPDDFLHQEWGTYGPCSSGIDGCEAYLIDLDGDGRPEVVVHDGSDGQPRAAQVMGQSSVEVYARDAKGVWNQEGVLSADCADPKAPDALRGGTYKIVSPRWRDLEINGQRFAFTTTQTSLPGCKGGRTSASVAVAPYVTPVR
jgi:hypothetical protein